MKTLFLSLLVCLVVVGTWFTADFFLFKKERISHQILLDKLNQKFCVVNDLTQLEKQPDYLQSYATTLEAELKSIQSQIPRSARISGLLALTSKLAEQEKITLHDFQTDNILNQGIYFELPIRLTVTASFEQLVRFLEALALQDRLLVVKDLEYEKSLAHIKLAAYFADWREEELFQFTIPYYCGEYQALKGFSSIVTTIFKPKAVETELNMIRDPFVPISHSEDLDALHLTGLFETRGDWLALLEYEDGSGKIVSVNDNIADGFVVKKIDSHGLWVSKNGHSREITWRKK